MAMGTTRQTVTTKDIKSSGPTCSKSTSKSSLFTKRRRRIRKQINENENNSSRAIKMTMTTTSTFLQALLFQSVPPLKANNNNRSLLAPLSQQKMKMMVLLSLLFASSAVTASSIVVEAVPIPSPRPVNNNKRNHNNMSEYNNKIDTYSHIDHDITNKVHNFNNNNNLRRQLPEWTGGPEDTFFCGYKWDDPDCMKRQHCPTGFHEECEGHEDGIKCFAYSSCDAKFGHGGDFVSGKPPKAAPTTRTSRPTYTGISDDPSDHYWCGVGFNDASTTRSCIMHCPSGTSSDCAQGHICFHDVTDCDARNFGTYPPTVALTTFDDSSKGPTLKPIVTPTKIPTEFPIPPPEPLTFPSDDPSDHWFCGVGIEDANRECGVHCPTANECPVGQICYFGTNCDGRTFEPTPPPTKRPTKAPTNFPTTQPTETMPPSFSPTVTDRPSASPTEQIPTRSPTQSPTKRPTFAPMPALQASFFCGIDWTYAISKCPKKCPSGEDPECPEGESCFAYTGCTEEMGYPEGEGDNVDGNAGDAFDPDTCVPFEVKIVADNWPQENSWTLTDENGETIAEGGGDELESGEATKWHECISKKRCYDFTIFDSGGDGICCDHGNGSYQLKFDDKVVKAGSAFYEKESTEFGRCGDTEAPTKAPVEEANTPSKGGGGGASVGGGSSYLCVASPLVQSGYEVAKNKCDKFTSCYNQFIADGDDWFCASGEECVAAPACATDEETKDSGGTSPSSGGTNNAMSYRCIAKPLAEKGYEISSDKCDLFDDCYNKDTGDGDDFFCEEIAQCVEAPACGSSDKGTAGDDQSAPSTSSVTVESSSSSQSDESVESDESIESDEQPAKTNSTADVAEPPVKSESATETDSAEPPTTPGKKPSATKPSGAGTKPTAVDDAKVNVTDHKSADIPTIAPTGNSTGTPTFNPTTYNPTYGPCGAPPCYQNDHCRSQYGFCGPGETYCNERATWTKDCPTNAPTVSQPPTTNAPSILPPPTTNQTTSSEASDTSTKSPVGAYDYFDVYTSPPTTSPPVPAYKKPGGKDKPSGGARPVKTRPPTTPWPTRAKPGSVTISNTASPTDRNTQPPTASPSLTPHSSSGSIDLVGFLENPPPSRSPTPGPTGKPTTSPTAAPSEDVVVEIQPTTSAPTTFSLKIPTGQTSPAKPKPSYGEENEFTCTGDPCPVETHCRSRYGSCGPGFIYCNVYSVWDKSCPPIIPGETPTRSPNVAPSDSPSIEASFISDDPTEPPKENSPTFEPVPKPTLKAVTDPLPLKQKPLGDAKPSSSIAESDKSVDDDDDDNVEAKENVEKEETESDASSSEYFNTFQSNEYLDSWTRARSAGVKTISRSVASMFLAAISSIGVVIILLIS